MQMFKKCLQYRSDEIKIKSSHHMKLLSLLMFGFFISSSLFAQNKEIRISRTDTPPRIDGELNDPAWQTCTKYSDFIQFDPFNGQPASENTSVRLAFDTDNLYVAFKCDDRKASKIAAHLTPREQFDANDYVTLILDTFDDQRTSYSFTINPKGVQKDEPGDYLWVSAALITSEGWQAEMKIPFKSIRFSKNEKQIWSVNFQRYLFRRNETDYITRVGRDEVLLDKSAKLTGLNQIRGGKNLDFFPYGGFRSSQSGDESEQIFAVGLDAKYGITSDLNLDVTMSPDFSEVESDPFFYQLSPYEYQLQEKRPFFQEGSRFLPDNKFFYSKRIQNPRMAGKLTGKQGKYTIGVVWAINKEDIKDGYIGAFNLQRDIFKFSKVAAMFSGYSNHDFRNFNSKINFDLKFSQIFSWDGAVQLTHNSDTPDSQNKYYKTSIDYTPDEGWRASAYFERIEKNYKPRAGIWSETNRQSFFFHPKYRFRLNKNGIKQLEFEWFIKINQAANGTPLGFNIRPFEVKLTTLKNYFVKFDIRFGRTKVQLRQDGSLYWHDCYFKQKQFKLAASYDGNRFYQIDYSFIFSETPVYNSDFSEAYDGRELEGGFLLSLRPASTIKLTVGTEYTKLLKKEDGSTLFEGALSKLGFNWQLTKDVFFSINLQHDSHNNRMKIDALLGIELGMGKTISISYKSRGAMPIRNAITGDEASTLLIKASYMFRI